MTVKAPEPFKSRVSQRGFFTLKKNIRAYEEKKNTAASAGRCHGREYLRE